MDKPMLDALMHRLNRLERNNHWWRLCASATFAILGLIVLLGGMRAQPVDEILAKRFILMDQGGKRRAMLGVQTKEEDPKAPGSTALIFYYGDEQPVRLFLQQNGYGGLLLGSESENTFLTVSGLWIAGGSEGSTILFPGSVTISQKVKGVKGETHLSPGNLQLSRRGTDLTTLDLSLDLSVDEGPSLKLFHKFLPRAQLFLAADGSPGLAFLDREGKPYTTVNKPVGESFLTAVPKLYHSCLENKRSKPSLDCSEYGKAMELLIRLFGR
jgi:hypothetical protein